jgi:hypothetical protein
MVVVVDNLEVVLVEAHNIKGWKWVHEQPLWLTWPLEKFGTSLPIHSIRKVIDYFAFSYFRFGDHHSLSSFT